MSAAPVTPGTAAEAPAVVYFDGVCGMCNQAVDFIILRDRHRRFRFAPLQGQTSAERLKLPPEELLKSIVYEDATGTYRPSDAAWRILWRLGGFWAFVGGMLRLVPRPLRNWGYDVIGRNRYRIFGKKESCRVPTREERQMFLP